MKHNLIGGEWLPGSTSRQNINPSDIADIVGEYAQADAEQARAAIDVAAQAQQAWRDSGIQTRATALDLVGSELLSRQVELGTLLSREEGKTLAEGTAEVARAGHIFKFFAAEALRTGGEKLPSVSSPPRISSPARRPASAAPRLNSAPNTVQPLRFISSR